MVVFDWSCFQAIPRKLWLSKSGKQLQQWPIEELETLRGKKVELLNQELKTGDHVEIKGITAAQVCAYLCIIMVFAWRHISDYALFLPAILMAFYNISQADVEVTFSLRSLDKAEPFDPSWVDAQDVCGLKGSRVKGGIGPFGLLTLASENLEEYTPVFFRVFKAQKKHVVLMCSDARRFCVIGF